MLDVTDAFIAEQLPGVSLTPQQRETARRAVWSVMQVAEHSTSDSDAQRILDEARRAERLMRHEPVWVTAARREALLEAVKA